MHAKYAVVTCLGGNKLSATNNREPIHTQTAHFEHKMSLSEKITKIFLSKAALFTEGIEQIASYFSKVKTPLAPFDVIIIEINFGSASVRTEELKTLYVYFI